MTFVDNKLLPCDFFEADLLQALLDFGGYTYEPNVNHHTFNLSHPTSQVLTTSRLGPRCEFIPRQKGDESGNVIEGVFDFLIPPHQQINLGVCPFAHYYCCARLFSQKEG